MTQSHSEPGKHVKKRQLTCTPRAVLPPAFQSSSSSVQESRGSLVDPSGSAEIVTEPVHQMSAHVSVPQRESSKQFD